MITLSSLLAVVVLAPARDAGPHPDRGAGLGRSIHFATLTEAEARQLQGRTARFLVELSSDPTPHDGWTLYECAGLTGPGPVSVERSVWLHQADADSVEDQAGDLVTVEAVLVVIKHRAWQNVPAWTELRLTRAWLAR